MNKAQNRNTEVNGLSFFLGAALIEVSCHRTVIIGFNIMIMTLKLLHDTISCLSYILYAASSASDQINDIFTLAGDIDFAVEIAFIGLGFYFTTQI